MDIIYTDRLAIREFTQVDIDKVFPILRKCWHYPYL